MIWRWICKLFGHRWEREPYQELKICARCSETNFRQLAMTRRAELKLDAMMRAEDKHFDAMLARDDIDGDLH